MNIENIKTVILAFLILSSLVMTWGLWSYQPQYELKQNQEAFENIKIGKTQEVSDLILPYQVIFHEDRELFGSMNVNYIKGLISKMQDWEFDEIEVVGSFTNINELHKLINEKNIVEFIYPVSIPEQAFLSLFPFNNETLELRRIDKIFVPQDENKDFHTAYFVSTGEQKVVKAELKQHVAEGDLPFERTKEHQMYSEIEIEKEHTVYLPKEPLKLPRLTYSAHQLLSTQFKNALFNNPNVVKQYSSNNGEESYTDGARALEVFYSQNKIRYINPTPEVYNMEAQDVLSRSIEYVNEHAGWTDKYMLYHLNENHQSTSFRLLVEGYPVFMNDITKGMTTIEQSWRSHEIYEYTRSLLNLSFSIKNQREYTQLPSGIEIINQLKERYPSYDSLKIEKVIIGYELSNDNTTFMFFEPNWYVLYDGKWEKVISNQGGNVIGLE